MKSTTAITAILLLSKIGFAQNSISTTQSYLQIQTGVGLHTGINFQQLGVAHKRGDFNEFDTDFDLNVNVKGKSEMATSYGFSASAGQLKINKEKKWNLLVGMNFNFNKAEILTTLANENNEIVSNINGANGAEVIDFVNEHYGTHHHIFENEFALYSYSTNAEIGFTKSLDEKTSIQTTAGFGVTLLDAKNAISRQMSPASTPPGFETTADEDGGAVNHFNGNNRAAGITNNITWKFGATRQLNSNLSLVIEGSSARFGKTTFNFGSTQYSDHAPTNHWKVEKDAHLNFQLSIGLRLTM